MVIAAVTATVIIPARGRAARRIGDGILRHEALHLNQRIAAGEVQPLLIGAEHFYHHFIAHIDDILHFTSRWLM